MLWYDLKMAVFEALYFEKCPCLHANTKKTSNGVNFNPKQQVTIKQNKNCGAMLTNQKPTNSNMVNKSDVKKGDV